jgi:hypothetical protein
LAFSAVQNRDIGTTRRRDDRSLIYTQRRKVAFQPNVSIAPDGSRGLKRNVEPAQTNNWMPVFCDVSRKVFDRCEAILALESLSDRRFWQLQA